MSRLFKKTSKTAGLPPGTLVHIGEKKTEKVRMTIMDYDESQFTEKDCSKIEECFPYRETPSVTWVNIDGIHQVEIIDSIGKAFNIHPLVLEDILNTGQRPKHEDFDNYIFIVLKMLYYDEKEKVVKTEQVSLILCGNVVISFQEAEGEDGEAKW